MDVSPEQDTNKPHRSNKSKASCCVPQCHKPGYVLEGENVVTFHRMPYQNTKQKILTKWLEQIKRHQDEKFKVTKHTKICSRHFTSNDFRITIKGKKYLRHSAIPSIFPWVKEKEIRTLPQEDFLPRITDDDETTEIVTKEGGTKGNYSFINANTSEWEQCGFLNQDGTEAEPDESTEDGDDDEPISGAEETPGTGTLMTGEVVDGANSNPTPKIVRPKNNKNEKSVNGAGTKLIVKNAAAAAAAAAFNYPNRGPKDNPAKPKQPVTQVVVLPKDFDFTDEEDEEDEEEEEEVPPETEAQPVEEFVPKYVEKTVVCLDHPAIINGRIIMPQTLALCKLMKDGMVTKLVLYEEMSASRVREEIMTVFAEHFNYTQVAFKYLKPFPGQLWLSQIQDEDLTGKQVLAMSGVGRIYIATYFKWINVPRPIIEPKGAYSFINASTTELEQQGLLTIKEEYVEVDEASKALTAGNEDQETKKLREDEEHPDREAETTQQEDEQEDEDTKSATEELPGPMRETIKLDRTGKIEHMEFLMLDGQQPVIKLERLDDKTNIRHVSPSPSSSSSTSSYGSSPMDTEEVHKEQHKELTTEDEFRGVKKRVEKTTVMPEAMMAGRQSSRVSAVKARSSIAMMTQLALMGDNQEADARRKRPLPDDESETDPGGCKLPKRRVRSKMKQLIAVSDEDSEMTLETVSSIPDAKKKAAKIQENSDDNNQEGVKKKTMVTPNCDLVDESAVVKRIRRRIVLRGSPAEDLGDKRYASHIKCKFCGDHQRTLLHLYQHLSVAHPYNNARFECQECGALHTNATEMETHAKIHCMRFAEVIYQVKRYGEGKYEYHCPVLHCKSKAMNWSKLINHLHYHRSKDCLLCGERIYPNPMKTFCTHVSTHIEGGPYVCPFCPRIFFNEMEDFRDHLMSVHGGDPTKMWVCRFCYKVFDSFSEFDLHLLGWHSNRPYCCQYCGQEFSSIITLEGHMERHDRGKDHDKLYSTCFNSFKVEKSAYASSGTVAGLPALSMFRPIKPKPVQSKNPPIAPPTVKQLLCDKPQKIQIIRKDGSVRMVKTMGEVQTLAENSRSLNIPRILKRPVVNITPKTILPSPPPVIQLPAQFSKTGTSLAQQKGNFPLQSGLFVLRPSVTPTPGSSCGGMQLVPLTSSHDIQQPMMTILKQTVMQHIAGGQLKGKASSELQIIPPKDDEMTLKITDIRSGDSENVANHPTDADSDNDEARPIIIEPIQDKPVTDSVSVRDSKGSGGAVDLKVCFHKHCFQVSQSAIDLWINHYFPKHFKREDKLEFMCCKCAALYANYDWPPMNHSCKKPTFIHVCTDCGLLFQMLREKVQHYQQCKFFVTEQSLLQAGTPMDLLTCQYCLDVLPNRTNLCSHLLEKHHSVRFDSTIICCEQCPVIRRFLDVEHLWEHNKIMHLEWWQHCGRWLCPYCGIDHTTEQEFNEHTVYSHAAYAPPHHFCFVCMDIFTTRVEYDYHSADCSQKRREKMSSYESTSAKQATVIAPLDDADTQHQRRLLQPEMMFDADPTPLIIAPDDDEDDSEEEVYIQVIQPEPGAFPAATADADVPADGDQSTSEKPGEIGGDSSEKTQKDARPGGGTLSKVGNKTMTGDDGGHRPKEAGGESGSARNADAETARPAEILENQTGGNFENQLTLAISDIRSCPVEPATMKMESRDESGMLKADSAAHKCKQCEKTFANFESLRDHAWSEHKPGHRLLVCPCSLEQPRSTMKWPYKYWEHMISNHFSWLQQFSQACAVCGELFLLDCDFRDHQIYGHDHDVNSLTIKECIEMVSKIKRVTRGKMDVEPLTETDAAIEPQAKGELATMPLPAVGGNQLESAIMISSSDEEESPATLTSKCNFTLLNDTDALSPPKPMAVAASEPDHACPDCGKHLPDLIALRKHQRAEHPTGLIKCEKCKQRIAVAEINHHVCGDEKTDAMLVIPCEFCEAKFAYLSNKNRHIAGKHRDELKRCITCGKAFVTQSTLDKHIERIHPSVWKSMRAMATEALNKDTITVTDSADKPKQSNVMRGAGTEEDPTGNESLSILHKSLGLPLKVISVQSPGPSKKVVFSKAKLDKKWAMKNTMHQMYSQKCRYCSKLIVNWSENNRHETLCKKNPIFREKKNLRTLLSEKNPSFGLTGDAYSEDEAEDEETPAVKDAESSHGGRIIALRHNVSSSDEEESAEVVFTDNPKEDIGSHPPRQTTPLEDKQVKDPFSDTVDDAQRRARDEEVFGPKSGNSVLVDEVFQQEADEKKKMLEQENRARDEEVFGPQLDLTSTLVEEVFGPPQPLTIQPMVGAGSASPKPVSAADVFWHESEDGGLGSDWSVLEGLATQSGAFPNTRSGSETIGSQPANSECDQHANEPIQIFPIGMPIPNCSKPVGNVLEICPTTDSAVQPIVIGDNLMGGSDGSNVPGTPRTDHGLQNNVPNPEKMLMESRTHNWKTPETETPTSGAILQENSGMEQRQEKPENIHATRAMDRNVKEFQDFLEKLEVTAPMDKLSPQDMSTYLTKFFRAAVKQDGTQYDANSLLATLYSIDRHLAAADYAYSLRSDPQFELARQSLQAKISQILKEGKRNVQNQTVSLNTEDEVKLRKAGVFGAETPFTLQFSIWYTIMMTTGLWSCSIQRKATWKDLTMEVDENGREYLNLHRCVAKKREGSKDVGINNISCRYYCLCKRELDECLIGLLKVFFLKRPRQCFLPGYPLYLTPITVGQSDTNWYSHTPLGAQGISTLLSDACALAGIEKSANLENEEVAKDRWRKAAVSGSEKAGHFPVHTLRFADFKLSDLECVAIQEEMVKRESSLGLFACRDLGGLALEADAVSPGERDSSFGESDCDIEPQGERPVKKWDEDVRRFINQNKKPDKYNTVKATRRDVKKFCDFLKSQMVFVPIEELSPQGLSKYLIEYLQQCVKKDGSPYEPLSLRTKLYSIDRYLTSAEYGYNLRIDSHFKDVWESVAKVKIKKEVERDTECGTVTEVRKMTLRSVGGSNVVLSVSSEPMGSASMTQDVNIKGATVLNATTVGSVDRGDGLDAKELEKMAVVNVNMDTNTASDAFNFSHEKMENSNTNRATNRDIRQFHVFLQSLRVRSSIEELSPHDLNKFLAKYFMTAVKKNGTPYEPKSLGAKLYSIDRYLGAAHYGYSLRHDPQFQLARDSLKAKRNQNTEEGMGTRASKTLSLSMHEETALRSAGVLGADTPFGLQFSIWYMLTMTMGIWGREEHGNLTWDDLTIKLDDDRSEYLDMFVPKSGERKDGTKVQAIRTRYRCTCDSENNECLIERLKKFFAKRPGKCCVPAYPLYLTPLNLADVSNDDEVWYSTTPMACQEIGSLVTDACVMAGIERRHRRRSNKGAKGLALKTETGGDSDADIVVMGQQFGDTLDDWENEQLSTSEVNYSGDSE